MIKGNIRSKNKRLVVALMISITILGYLFTIYFIGIGHKVIINHIVAGPLVGITLIFMALIRISRVEKATEMIISRWEIFLTILATLALSFLTYFFIYIIKH